MRLFIAIIFCSVTSLSFSQDITGTWEGDLVSGGGTIEGLQRNFKMKWELVQVEKEVFGIVYFYPQDTKDGDKPNSWYTWYGKFGKKNLFPFQFIKGRFIDGLGASGVYQFNVKFAGGDTAEVLTGNWYTELESLNSKERPAGFYKMNKVSSRVSDQLWLKRKEKEIIEKLEKQRGVK